MVSEMNDYVEQNRYGSLWKGENTNLQWEFCYNKIEIEIEGQRCDTYSQDLTSRERPDVYLPNYLGQYEFSVIPNVQFW